MFLRVSSPVCASDVDANPRPHHSLPRPSTQCGVVDPHVRIALASAEPSGPPAATAYFCRVGRPRRLSRVKYRCRLRGSCRARRAERAGTTPRRARSEEHTSELQSLAYLVCRLLLEK